MKRPSFPVTRAGIPGVIFPWSRRVRTAAAKSPSWGTEALQASFPPSTSAILRLVDPILIPNDCIAPLCPVQRLHKDIGQTGQNPGFSLKSREAVPKTEVLEQPQFIIFVKKKTKISPKQKTNRVLE
jgi:hypothetical protein